MGFGSIFGSLGRAIKRPFKDIHKAVKGSGRFMNRGIKKTFGGGGGASKTSESGTGTGGFSGIRDRMKAGKVGPLVNNAPGKVSGSQGKKAGEWIGSKYIGSGPKPEDMAQKKKKKPIMGSNVNNKVNPAMGKEGQRSNY